MSTLPRNIILRAVGDRTQLAPILTQMGLGTPRPTLVLIGGADYLNERRSAALKQLFAQVLAPLAQELGLYVVDGGTDAGVMRLMGQARQAIGGSFPLIGVAPNELVLMPGETSLNPDAAPLEIHHTHCLLVPGTEWGAESAWIAATASVLAGSQPSATVLVNGGNVAWKDALCSVEAGRPLWVMLGSGRTADQIAMALQGSRVKDDRAYTLLESGLLRAIDVAQPVAELQTQFHQIFR